MKLRSRIVNACDSERARIASDLHDEMGPELFALNAAASQARNALACLAGPDVREDVSRLHEAVAAIQRHTLAIQECARGAINELRPIATDAATLGEMLEEIVAGFQDAAETTRFIVRADVVLRAVQTSEITEVTIYRFVRESVLNALRHGEPDLVEVSLRCDRDGLLVRVADTGPGPAFSHTVPGCGQLGMRERARALGALYCPPWREADRTITELRVPIR